MKHAYPHTTPLTTDTKPSFEVAHICQRLPDGRYRLRNGQVALQAVSCVVVPQANDEVLLLTLDTQSYITHILCRQTTDAQLQLPGIERLDIVQGRLGLNATQHLGLCSGGDVELNALQGSVWLQARNVFTTVSDSVVTQAQQLVSHAQNAVMQIAALLRLHGRQNLITAEQDMKLDAERISLG